MIKKRSPYGTQMSLGSLVAQLKPNDLLATNNERGELDESWQYWWQASSAEQFYVDDLFVLRSPEFHHKSANNL
jgi:predicted alpha-1,6-mannanase (GH76 family)